MSRITIIGPRLQDIAGFKDNNINTQIQDILAKTLEKHRSDILLSSCSLGIEMWACELAMYYGIAIELVVPCQALASKWPKNSQQIYSKALKYATVIHASNDPWSGKLMYAKDKMLCEQAEHVYHFYNILPRFIPQDKSTRLFSHIKDDTLFDF